MTENKKTFLELSQEDRLVLVQHLQATRAQLKENSKKKKQKKGSKRTSKNTSTKKKPFKFEDPQMQAMFDLLPADFKKKFGVKG